MTQPQNLGLARKVGYASGNFGKSVVWSSIDYLLLYFLTDIWGIPASIAGLIILAGLLWDGITDPLVGYIADRTDSRAGKYGPFLVIGAPLCALSFTLLFLNPGLGPETIGWYALGTGLLFRTCYKICDVPHNALLARISTTSKDRSLISGLRFFFSSSGALCVAVAASFIFAIHDTQEQSGRFTWVSAFGGVAYFVTVYAAFASTRILDRTLPNKSKAFDLTSALSALWQNKQLCLLFSLALIQVITVPFFAKGVVYFAKYEINDETWIGPALMAMTIGQGISMPLWIWLSHIKDKHHALWLAYMLAAFSIFFFFVFGKQIGELRLSLIVSIGIAFGGMNMLIWAMLPDLVDYGEWQTGRRIEALSFGFFTLFLKCGLGVGTALFGSVLTSVGYKPNVSQDSIFSDSLMLLMCGAPIVGVLLCAALLSKYTVGHKTHAEISGSLVS
jgi:GPH family glycoside/pentoside/hexuronide:cation symporter